VLAMDEKQKKTLLIVVGVTLMVAAVLLGLITYMKAS
jgi:hypothetical protein